MVSDESLIERYKDGDESAFNELIRRYQKSIYFLSLRMVKDHEKADEITQRTFINVFRGITGFRKKSSFKTWIYQVTINLCRNYLRNDKANISEPIEMASNIPGKSPDPVKAIFNQEIKNFLQTAIDNLSERQRTTLILKVYHEFTFLEIAQSLNCSVGTAKANFHQAIKKLRNFVKNNENFFKEKVG